MATAASLDSGSRFCVSCEGDGISNAAYSYCFNCDSAFCVSCDKSHSKFAKDHKVVVGDDMPEHVTDEKLAFVPCALHSKENMDLYCKDHEVALCNICKHTVHRKCDVQNLSSAFEEIDVSKWRDEVSTRVMTLLGIADEIDSNNQLLLKKVNENTDEMRNTIDHLRTEMNNVLDRYLEQLNAQHMPKIDVITDNSKACKSFSEYLKNQKDALENSKGNRVKELFTLTETNKLCKEYSFALEEIKNEAVPSEVAITEDDKMPSLIQQISRIAYRDTADSEEVPEEMTATQSRKKSFLNIKTCSFVQEQDVKMINDSNTPCITGCCFIPNERLVVCDYSNQKVKFLDKDMKIYFAIPYAKGPWDVDCLNEDCIVVTIPATKSIQFIHIKPGIKSKYKCDIGYKVYGVAVNDKHIFAIIADMDKQQYGVQILNQYGDYVAFIKHIGSELYMPQHICTNIDGSKMYYSGGSNRFLFVNCLTRVGFALYSIRTRALELPKTLICDDDENLIVCDAGTKCLHVINSGGVVGDMILSEQDGFSPQSMCFDKLSDKLIVASWKEKDVKLTVYKLEYD